VNHIGEAELFTRPYVSNVEFAWKFYRQLLLRNLSEVCIGVRRDSVLTHNASDANVVLHNRDDFSIAKLVTSDLGLRQRLAVQRRHLNRRFDTGLLKHRSCGLPVPLASKLRSPQLWILIPGGV
jgi:hypothetical protein